MKPLGIVLKAMKSMEQCMKHPYSGDSSQKSLHESVLLIVCKGCRTRVEMEIAPGFFLWQILMSF